ncbi:MAG: DUF4145 domain-containing protein [Gemmataceae bacterium]|nr:DUF4145 domain-containing protein [Gemmataceae bacterium]
MNTVANKDKIQPRKDSSSFQCPSCKVVSMQRWGEVQLRASNGISSKASQYSLSRCDHCHEYAFWLKDRMVFPLAAIAPHPNPDMPEDVKDDYSEADIVLSYSPRSSAALLRLALQKLMLHLGEKGKDINEDIKSLVAKGLRSEVQMALDAVRVIGNEAVHPGLIDLRDDRETAFALFGLLNYIVDQMITHPKTINALYAKLPVTKKEGIEKRDGKSKAV